MSILYQKKSIHMNYIRMKEEEEEDGEKTLPLICFSPQGN